MRDILLYKQLCNVDLCNHGLRNRYPYAMQETLQFTHHQIALQYKHNYCKSIKVLEPALNNEQQIQKGAAEHQIQYSFINTDFV